MATAFASMGPSAACEPQLLRALRVVTQRAAKTDKNASGEGGRRRVSPLGVVLGGGAPDQGVLEVGDERLVDLPAQRVYGGPPSVR